MANKVLFVVASAALFLAYAQAGVIKSVDEETCLDLCKNCKGEAKFVDKKCVCDFAANTKDGVQCLTRMKREASDHGLDFFSCKASSDQRSTRCTLGSKRLLGAKDIDKVANYFMKDGPVLGNIFIAPPLAKKPDCVVGSKIITQPPETMEPKHTANCVGAPQVAAPQPIVASPEPQQYQLLGESNCGCVGSPQNEAPQLEETFTYQDVTFDNCNPGVAQPAVAAPMNVFKLPTLTTPTILQLLGRQFVQPLLGIPNAFQTMTSAPGVQELVSAPATLLNSLAHKISPEYVEMKENLKQQIQQSIDDSNARLGAMKDKVEKSFKDLTVAAPKLAKSPCNVVGKALSPPTINLPEPKVASPPAASVTFTPAAASISFPSPVVGSPAPTSFTYASPFVGAAQPVSYIPVPSMPAMSYMPNIQPYMTHMPTYIVSMPYIPNYNNLESYSLSNQEQAWSDSEAVDQNVGQPLIIQEPKKICKKSVNDEVSKKVTRGANSISDTFDDDAAFNKMKNEIEAKAELKKRETTTEIPKIDRTTTQKPVMEAAVEEVAVQEEEKPRPARELIKKFKKYGKKYDEKKSNDIKI